jgi:hypothetical protein
MHGPDIIIIIAFQLKSLAGRQGDDSYRRGSRRGALASLRSSRATMHKHTYTKPTSSNNTIGLNVLYFF